MLLDLPASLKPTNLVRILLPSGRVLALPYCYPSFPKWPHEHSLFTFGNKTILDFEGQPVFAELMILKLLQRAGWGWRLDFILRWKVASGNAHELETRKRN